MPRLPSLTGKQLVAALGTLGFELVRTRGSHHFLQHPDGRAHLFVDDIVTAEGARGGGHGAAMMRALAALAAADGIPRIYLDARLTAKGFYEKLGFTFLTAVPCWIQTGDLDEKG